VSETEVRYEVDDAVARDTIDRPERRNAMSFGVMQGLLDSMRRARDDAAVHVVVLTGEGERAFCAGADLGGIADNAGPAAVRASGRLCYPSANRAVVALDHLWQRARHLQARV
jgi:enoyl-CoA hydratase/carnithine racemase